MYSLSLKPDLLSALTILLFHRLINSFEFSFLNRAIKRVQPPVTMSYTNWDRSPAKRLARVHSFCSFQALSAFVHAHRLMGFYHHVNRVNMIGAYQALRSPAPFGEHARFPDNDDYVDLDHVALRSIFDQITGACDLDDRRVNSNVPGSSSSSLSDAKRSFEVSFNKLRDFVVETKADLLVNVGIYSRESFEEAMSLVWAPAQEGPRPE